MHRLRLWRLCGRWLRPLHVLPLGLRRLIGAALLLLLLLQQCITAPWKLSRQNITTQGLTSSGLPVCQPDL